MAATIIQRARSVCRLSAKRSPRLTIYTALQIRHRHHASQLYSKGSGIFGSLGHGHELQDSLLFKEVQFPSISIASDKEPGDNIIQSVSAGWGHSAAVTKNGELFIFGRPYDFSAIMRIDRIHRLSSTLARYVASSTNSSFFGTASAGLFPIPVQVLVPDVDRNNDQSKIESVSCSAGLTSFITSAGSVYCFGLNRWGQCGFESADSKTRPSGASELHVYSPVRVPSLPACDQVDAGLQHCIALTRSSDSEDFDSASHQSQPTRRPSRRRRGGPQGPGGQQQHPGGVVYTWGKGHRGQLGTGLLPDDAQSALPRRVMLPCGGDAGAGGKEQAGSSVRAVEVSAGFAHCAALGDDGALFVWGRGMSQHIKGESTELAGR